METPGSIFFGKAGEQSVELKLALANRHGLIAGATGTGKTVTLQVLAEAFSRSGVPVFTADVKGDLSGLAVAGTPSDKLNARVQKLGLEGFGHEGTPVLFWDLHGKKGHPIRTTISEMGPLLLARLLDLNETQEGVLQIAFRMADEEGLLLLDLKDLRSMLAHLAEHRAEVQQLYGNVSTASIGAIQRRLLVLEEAGGTDFFGEPALRLDHIMQHDFSGRGVVSILDATSLMSNPQIYSTFLLWLLSELFEELPEVGDLEKPKLVFFFDEAHLLFRDAPKALLEKIETVARLIRSKGVGVFFVTQNPADVPERVLSQLGNRVQHALRAFTPKDRKVVRAAAENFRSDGTIDVEEAITQLEIGEALVSTLDHKGAPGVVVRTLISPPSSRMGPASQTERADVLVKSPLRGVYEDVVDRHSAYEMLKQRREQGVSPQEAQEPEERKAKGHQRQSYAEAFFKSVLRNVGGTLGRKIMRGIFGTAK
ncbi:MAG: DUF853 family protein [Bdellovibrionales bacterium]|nr:DUF853 family protein [Bdellovibrionales bacterium]